MRVLSGNVYRLQVAVGDVVKPRITVEAADADEADRAALAHFSNAGGYNGEPIRVVALSQVDVDRDFEPGTE